MVLANPARGWVSAWIRGRQKSLARDSSGLREKCVETPRAR